MRYDHGYEVNENKRCSATTKKQRQCTQQALAGIDLCALHSGLAKAHGKAGFGDPQALEAYKRGLAARQQTPAQARRAVPR